MYSVYNFLTKGLYVRILPPYELSKEIPLDKTKPLQDPNYYYYLIDGKSVKYPKTNTGSEFFTIEKINLDTGTLIVSRTKNRIDPFEISVYFIDLEIYSSNDELLGLTSQLKTIKISLRRNTENVKSIIDKILEYRDISDFFLRDIISCKERYLRYEKEFNELVEEINRNLLL